MAEANGNKKDAAAKNEPRKLSNYIVLQLISGEMQTDAGPVQVQEAWVPIGKYEALTQDVAKRLAAANIDISEGGQFTLCAVPAASWKPITAKLHRPEPKLVLS